MEFPVDIAPEQILHWLRSEISARPDEFSVRVEREFAAAAPSDKADASISEDTDLTEASAIGLIEVRPADPSAGWMLRMRAEDQLGDHLPDGRSVAEGAEEIELDSFEELFLTPSGRALVETVLHADTPEAAVRAGPLFENILTDRHAR